MTEGGDMHITLTTDEVIIRQCAAMMAESDPWVTLGMGYDYCLRAFEGPCKEIFTAQYKQKLAGFVILQTCGSFKGYIQTLCMGAELRGKGLGTKMLGFCEKRILEISPNIFICVSSFNEGAINLYYRFGFTLVGELPNFVKQGYTELLLRKTVGPIAGYCGNKEKSNG